MDAIGVFLKTLEKDATLNPASTHLDLRMDGMGAEERGVGLSTRVADGSLRRHASQEFHCRMCGLWVSVSDRGGGGGSPVGCVQGGGISVDLVSTKRHLNHRLGGQAGRPPARPCRRTSPASLPPLMN